MKLISVIGIDRVLEMIKSYSGKNKDKVLDLKNQPYSALNQLRKSRGVELYMIYTSLNGDRRQTKFYKSLAAFYSSLSTYEKQDLKAELNPIANEDENSSS